MKKQICIIVPRSSNRDDVGFNLDDVFGSLENRIAVMSDLASVTVAALVPDDFQVSVIDERTMNIDFQTTAQIIMITGKFSQEQRMKEIASCFFELGKVVVIGGVFATLYPEFFEGCCNVLVQGELEPIAKELFSDLLKGTQKPHYQGYRISLENSPIPAWHLYPTKKHIVGAIQFSRGCPKRCDFCDVIRFFEGTVRFKTIKQILEELNILSKYYSYAFFVDDNFFASKKKGVELLHAIIDWQSRQEPEERMSFVTQLTMSVLADTELLDLLDRAGFRILYIGLESINPENYASVNKSHNENLDLDQCFNNLYSYNILPYVGLMFGFDNDKPGVFQEVLDFAEKHCFTMMHINTLVAPVNSPLYDKLKKEGRIDSSEGLSFGHISSTNIIPKNMTKQELLQGVYDFTKTVYDPIRFTKRVLRLLEKLPDPSRFKIFMKNMKLANLQMLDHIHNLTDPDYEKHSDVFKSIWELALQEKKARTFLMQNLSVYLHIAKSLNPHFLS